MKSIRVLDCLDENELLSEENELPKGTLINILVISFSHLAVRRRSQEKKDCSVQAYKGINSIILVSRLLVSSYTSYKTLISLVN